MYRSNCQFLVCSIRNFELKMKIFARTGQKLVIKLCILIPNCLFQILSVSGISLLNCVFSSLVVRSRFSVFLASRF